LEGAQHPESKLARTFTERYDIIQDRADARRTARPAVAGKSLIVAMARKLLIELWRFVTTGETLVGVEMRPA